MSRSESSNGTGSPLDTQSAFDGSPRYLVLGTIPSSELNWNDWLWQTGSATHDSSWLEYLGLQPPKQYAPTPHWPYSATDTTGQHRAGKPEVKVQPADLEIESGRGQGDSREQHGESSGHFWPSPHLTILDCPATDTARAPNTTSTNERIANRPEPGALCGGRKADGRAMADRKNNGLRLANQEGLEGPAKAKGTRATIPGTYRENISSPKQDEKGWRSRRSYGGEGESREGKRAAVESRRRTKDEDDDRRFRGRTPGRIKTGLPEMYARKGQDLRKGEEIEGMREGSKRETLRGTEGGCWPRPSNKGNRKGIFDRLDTAPLAVR